MRLSQRSNMKTTIIFAAVVAFSVLTMMPSVSCQEFTSNYDNPALLKYTSTDSIADADLSTILPSLPSMYQAFTQVGGVFGYYGPLGPFGPLGTLGPIGSNFWNPSQLISGISWNSYASFLTLNGGPLSQFGPLGSTGPLNPDIYLGIIEPGKSLFQSSPYAKHLRGFGLWSALGSIGPLGALGPLGPLGPLGGHGYKADSNGNYRDDNNQIVREVAINYDGTHQRTYSLVEKYSDSYASANPSLLDTSFMVLGSLTSSTNAKFTFTSSEDEIVTIVLVPEKSLDSFAFGVYDQRGRLVGASCEQTQLISTMQINVKAGQQLTVLVQLNFSMHFLSKTYRLIVVGSTHHLNMNNVQGDHIQSHYTSDDDTTGRCSTKFPKVTKVPQLMSETRS